MKLPALLFVEARGLWHRLVVNEDGTISNPKGCDVTDDEVTAAWAAEAKTRGLDALTTPPPKGGVRHGCVP